MLGTDVARLLAHPDPPATPQGLHNRVGGRTRSGRDDLTETVGFLTSDFRNDDSNLRFGDET